MWSPHLVQLQKIWDHNAVLGIKLTISWWMSIWFTKSSKAQKLSLLSYDASGPKLVNVSPLPTLVPTTHISRLTGWTPMLKIHVRQYQGPYRDWEPLNPSTQVTHPRATMFAICNLSHLDFFVGERNVSCIMGFLNSQDVWIWGQGFAPILGGYIDLDLSTL